MAIYIGGSSVSAIYIGGSEVASIYEGSALVWSKPESSGSGSGSGSAYGLRNIDELMDLVNE